MNLTPYKTVKRAAQTELTIKKSVFIGNIAPVTTESEALDFLEGIRRSHCEASHNVYSYIIREGNIIRFSDDGEPSSTAGMPVQSVLQKSGVTNVCAVITRYFGGILLGAGGLVRAYTAAAAAALEVAGTAIFESFTEFYVMCGYQDADKITRYVKTSALTVKNVAYESDVTFTLAAKSEEYSHYMNELLNLTDGRVIFDFIGCVYGTLNF